MWIRRLGVLSVLAVALALVGFPSSFAQDEDVELVEPPSWWTLSDLVSGQFGAVDQAVMGEASGSGDASPAALTTLVIGEARVAAAERVLWDHPGLPLSVHELVIGGSPLLFEFADRQGPVNSWQLESSARRWESFEASLEELRQRVAEFGPERVCPVASPADFENDWHDARPGGRAHKGNDLHGEVGTPLLAIEAGTVVQANWHPAGGRQIYFRADSTGDVYYYAHLETWAEWIWTGTSVEAGDEIGTLGRSGNADSPHLHFGWMPGSMKVDLDNLQNPYPLLVELCAAPWSAEVMVQPLASNPSRSAEEPRKGIR